MNYCDLIKKIQQDPHKLMEEHLGRPMKVRDMYEFKEHVNTCLDCQDIIEDINTKYPAPEGFHKGDLN